MPGVDDFIKSLNANMQPGAPPRQRFNTRTEDPVVWGPTTSPALGDAGYQVSGAPYVGGKTACDLSDYPYLAHALEKNAFAGAALRGIGAGLSRVGRAVRPAWDRAAPVLRNAWSKRPMGTSSGFGNLTEVATASTIVPASFGVRQDGVNSVHKLFGK